MTNLMKRAYDVRNFSVDVGPAMREQDSIMNVVSVEENKTTDLTIDEITHDAAVIFFRVAGGLIARKSYQIILRFDTESNPGQMIEVVVGLEINQ